MRHPARMVAQFLAEVRLRLVQREVRTKREQKSSNHLRDETGIGS